MQQGDPRLPGNNGSRTDSGPTGGGRGTRERGLGVGKERTRGIPCTGGGGSEGAGTGGGRLEGGGIIYYLFFLFFPFISCQASKGGGGGTRWREH